MITDDQIRSENLQDNINREDAKRSTFSSGKIDKHEYVLVKKYHHLIKNT